MRQKVLAFMFTSRCSLLKLLLLLFHLNPSSNLLRSWSVFSNSSCPSQTKKEVPRSGHLCSADCGGGCWYGWRWGWVEQDRLPEQVGVSHLFRGLAFLRMEIPCMAVQSNPLHNCLCSWKAFSNVYIFCMILSSIIFSFWGKVQCK